MDNAQKSPATPNIYRSMPMDSSSERRMTVTLFSIFLPMVVAGFILHASVEPPPKAVTSVTLSEVADGHLVEIRDATGAVVLSGEFRSRVDSLGNIEKDAELTDQQGRTVIGEVELEIPAAGRDHRRPELEVDVINLKPRQQYRVVIDDRTVGAFVTDDRGSADFELQEGEMLPGRTG
jgi:hypothetical protein